jgi:hypothetical protein
MVAMLPRSVSATASSSASLRVLSWGRFRSAGAESPFPDGARARACRFEARAVPAEKSEAPSPRVRRASVGCGPGPEPVLRLSVDSSDEECDRTMPASAACLVRTGGAAPLAILAPVGEIDPLGTRRDALDVFLDQKVEEGYVIETRSDTHAIIFRRPKGLKRFTSGPDPGRYVVQVDEDGIATMRPAEPRRT